LPYTPAVLKRDVAPITGGRCANQGNVPFPDISAGTGGAVKAGLTSSITAPGGFPADSYLNVHLTPSARLGKPGSLGFTPIACADIPPGATTSATLIMQAPTQASRCLSAWSLSSSTRVTLATTSARSGRCACCAGRTRWAVSAAR
jgi:hypothetical protein